MVAQVSRDERQRVARVDGVERLFEPAFPGQVDVFGNVLVDGTRHETGGHETVEKRERSFDVDLVRPAEVLSEMLDRARGISGGPGPLRVYPGGAPRLGVPLGDLRHLLQAGVPARSSGGPWQG